MAAVTICSDFGAPKNSHCFDCFPIYLALRDGTGCHYLSFLNVELEANFFTLHFHFHQEDFHFLFTFCHKGGVICISEVIDISPGNLDSSLCCFQSSVSHAYKLNKQGDNIQPWRTPFPIWNQSVVPCPVLTVASWPAYRFLKRQFRCSGIPISFRIFQFIVIYTVKCFGIVNKAEIDK